METNYFAFIPVEVIQDKRLTLEQTRVLIALFSFRGRDTNTVWPSREAISNRTGMHISNISQATKSLADLGWLTKNGAGGFSKATRYTITTPEKFKKDDVAQSATVAQQATGGVAQSAMSTVAQSATGKELTIELTKELKDIRAAKPRSRSGLKVLKTYIEECKANGVKPIPDDHHSREFARDAGIEPDMLAMCWFRFLEDHTTGARSAKRYKDWGQAFGNAVKANWYKFWFMSDDGVQWTSQGRMYKTAYDAKHGD